MKLVSWLEDLGKNDVALAGGKAAHLGELLHAGLPVPPGFVVTTAAYQQFITANGLQPEIERLANEVHPDDAPGLDAAAQAIAARFAAGTIPQAIADAVREAYTRMGMPSVAVRSSATAEDLPAASFAGQMETYLNVRGHEDLLAAIRRCWASLWTPRAISYRTRQGIPHAAVSLAVVVQELIDADAAGVLFTANPVTGHRHQMVCDAVWGLGEALVGGRATPDHWRVDARTGAVLEAHIARKDVMTVRTDSGTQTVPIPADRRDRPVLEDAQLAALVALGRRVASHYGSPQDIEWVLADGRLSLVQSRPITLLFPLPEPVPSQEAGLRVYLCANLVQGFVEPFTPMGVAVLRSVISGVAALVGVQVHPGEAPAVFKVAAGRAFADATPVLRHPKGRRVFPHLVELMDPQTAAILRSLLERNVPPPGRERFPMRLRRLVLKVGRLLSVALFPDDARQRALAWSEQWMTGLEHQAQQLSGVAARRRFLEAMLPRVWPQLFDRLVPFVFLGLGARFLAQGLLQDWLGDAAGLQPGLRSPPHNPTTEMGLALWRVSRQLKAEGAEPSADHPAVRGFLAKYGHRGVREIDAGMPRWREEPGHVLNLLRTYLTHDEVGDAEQRFREGERAAEAAVADLVRRVRERKGRLRAAVLRFLLRRVRALTGLREYPKFYAVRGLALARQVLRGAGAELVAAGKLDRVDEVFFLDLRDLGSAADLRAVAAANRAEYQRELGRRLVPRVMTSDGETFYTAPGAVPGALVGTAASPGIHEGRVRVIFEPQGAKLEPGEVLVAPGTDPAWTPLFLSAGALVMEIGGIISHGSVVAREYGIPAVVGVTDATRRLQTGQRVRVDGESGQVVLLS
jgi:pyruvate,water dikinase